MTRKSFDRKNIFQFSYNIIRSSLTHPSYYDDMIYKGFGLKHKSDTTDYYVSCMNTTGKSAVCQPIGEAIGLVTEILLNAKRGTSIATYRASDNSDITYLVLDMPQEYRTNGIIPPELWRYRVARDSDKIFISAYDSDDNLLDDEFLRTGEIHYHPLYKLLPIFTLLILDHKMIIPQFSNILENFAINPNIKDFVQIHEDFYHMNKSNAYKVKYTDCLSFKPPLENILDEKVYYSDTLTTPTKHKNHKKTIINQFNVNQFSQKQQDCIPNLPKELVLPDEYRPFCNAVYDGASIATLFHGPSGTGKSMLCKLICQAINLPVMQIINCSENLDEFIFGKYIPKEEKIIFHENPITEAVRNGGAAIFEEINFAKPQHLAFLHSLLDDNGIITLDDGTIVKRHPNFRIFATMNDGYFGTKELNQATINRFNYIKEVPELSDEAIMNMLTTRIPQFANYVDQMLSVYKSIKSKAEAEDIDITISPRNLENWAKIAQYEGFIDAAKSTILPVTKMDRKLEQAILDIINTYKWAA